MESVDQYIESFPADIREMLEKVRAVIRQKAPDAVETMGYGVPAYRTNGKPLVYFAGFRKHIGFYATPAGHEAFSAELSQYKQGKGSVQFPFNRPIPYDLIGQIVEFRVKENDRLEPVKKKLE
jgi:uncharacterized protein YdhG (YjbR/CyaY superfamily)